MERADVLHLNTFSSRGTPRDTFLFSFPLLFFFLLFLLLLLSFFSPFLLLSFFFLSLLLLVYLEAADALENSCDEPRHRNRDAAREDVQSTVLLGNGENSGNARIDGSFNWSRRKKKRLKRICLFYKIPCSPRSFSRGFFFKRLRILGFLGMAIGFGR